MSAPTVVAVVVSYNRAELLRCALDALAAQTRPVDRVVVVDNASTDDAPRVAREHPAAPEVVALARNTGGAGGFAVGIATAVTDHAADLVWVMDDDTIPTPSALSELLAAREAYDGDVAALCSKVVWTDGSDHPMNTPRSRPGASSADVERARAAGAMPVRSMSFVSMMIDAADVRRVGLPVTDYFIWNDDFEYATRLLRDRVGLYVPGSVVEHRTKKLGATDADPGPRFYYEVRNKVWMFTRSDALSIGERVLYGGSTLRRWVRTVRRSQDRATLARAGLRGLRHGLIRGPRPDTEVLSGVGAAALTVARLEAGASAPAPVPVGRIAQAAGPFVAGEPLEDRRFSVLLPVYRGDDAAHLERAFRSVTTDQTLRPDEVVVVRDGPVGEELAKVLDRLPGLTDVPVSVVPLPRNLGLASALEEGLAVCRHEIVARADADDISLPARFAEQVPLVASGFDIVGSAIWEFDEDEHDRGLVRVPPTGAGIAVAARFRDPFNHPSVVYRRSAVAAVGGYQHLDLMEDYLLFARMLAAGAHAENITDPLVLYRVGAGAYARRGGRRLLASELALQRTLHDEGFVSTPQLVRNVLVRAGYRLVPERIRAAGYRAYTRRRGGYLSNDLQELNG
ncbi:glycosyltransferase [Isoptericola sp. 178]|uniref:glycosyltransferase n=1 Tax=Isoptericola sp. 178 TaxID=3064651 RepID=UPI0027133360|nr:glycosyltransferase [Isoptericola sp. 178]MDO8144128.1 glycosyltransferase [Isoptericola sp. 178]